MPTLKKYNIGAKAEARKQIIPVYTQTKNVLSVCKHT
jgi:hypothetical protein